ncbi:hypothetical protein [Streptomyces rhizosphaerihabitans]|uniref:hypothetical protein n=1 Tax=Streptomyces rhizosphaerihabitans TaxID=1266770 RepID=UPI0021C23005|nr:hypothetical protein [Streptomyces rhizosphaerihabitans]MCT9011525.1 hypothetical protein [Streptomyces rhizosphaerihabitans]
MSEYDDHVRHSLEGQNVDPGEDLRMDAMRWTPAPDSNTVTAEEIHASAEKAHALLDRAANAYLSLLNAVLGDGTHHMVASATTPHGDVTEGQELTVMGDALIINEATSMRVCAVIAAGMVGCATGGLVVRTFHPDGSEFVRGWGVRNLWLHPLTAQDIRQAYTVDTETGAPVAPEPGVEYRQAEQVPCPEAEASTSRTTPPDNRPPNRRN